MRIGAIDAFRGVSIVLMVFFKLISRLGHLPEVLRHNVSDTLHVGDFVLPMFLFASGMSLVFFHKKREKKEKTSYVLDIVEKIGKLVLISFLISPFSVGGILEMDEVMLNAVLFVPAVLLVALPEVVISAVALLTLISYFILLKSAMLPDFTAHYLGGYTAAVFYLPVMLGGVLTGKKISERKNVDALILTTVALSIVLVAVIPVDKMSATPSFMALSVVLSLLVYKLIEYAQKQTEKCLVWNYLEYLGKDPIRYWVLMFAILIAPISFYALYSGSGLPIGIEWKAAAIISIICIPVLYFISICVDIPLIYLRLKSRV